MTHSQAPLSDLDQRMPAHRAGRLKILMLVQIVPYPLDAGPKARAYHVLRWLAARAELTLVCFSREDDPPEALEHLRGICHAFHAIPIRRSKLRDAWYLVQALASRRSFIILRDRRSNMLRALREHVDNNDFDALHVDQLWMAGYANHLKIPLRVLDNHNAVYLVFQRLADGETNPLKRWFFQREARTITRYEANQLSEFDHTLFVSENDREAMRSVASENQLAAIQERTSVLPICVDVSSVAPVIPRDDARRITILGTMFWPPNAEGVRWFVDQILPAILTAMPDAILTVIGKRPPSDLLSLSERFGPSVEVCGYVEDLQPYLEETAVFAVPLLSGGGMRVKILDAWAWQLPVVSTQIGAEGLEYQTEEDILIADDAEGFAKYVIGLLRDKRLREAIGRGGRDRVASHYNSVTVYDQLESIYAPNLAREKFRADPIDRRSSPK